MTFSFSVRLGRFFLVLDGVGPHMGWDGRWEAAWTETSGWVFDRFVPVSGQMRTL